MKPQALVIAVTQFRQPLMKQTPGQLEGSDCARVIEYGGRICYDSFGKGRTSEQFHQHLLDVGHGSVLEHANLSFHLSGISRACANEWVRHRAGCAVSQRSTRYVDEGDSEWAWHPLIERVRGHDSWPLVDWAQKRAQDSYRILVEVLEPETGRKQARGAARGVLGNALATEMVWTANIRALRNVIEQRATPFADAEIRLLANAVYEAAKEEVPEYLSDYERQESPDGIGYCLSTQYRKI